MSLPERFPSEIPPMTRAIVEPLMKPNEVCRWMGQHVHEVLDEDGFVTLYAELGRARLNPIMLSMVLILQFLENFPDRQAVHQAVMWMDWKYALRQALGWEGFDFSTLCYFRRRLYAHGQERMVFEQVLQALVEEGFVKRQRQRTDATHVLAAVERLSRLELVLETLRLALGALTTHHAGWVLTHIPPSWVETYQHKREDYRLTSAQIEQPMRQAGQDGFWLLAQLSDDQRALPALARVLGEQFTPPDPQTGTPAQARANVDACGDVIASPHDPEARYSRKGERTSWTGYKVQVTETVDAVLPLITDIALHRAIEPDNLALAPIQDRLAARDLAPLQHYTDMGYCNAATIVDSAKRGIDLRGRVAHSGAKAPGFRLEDFEVDVAQRTAVCPQGHPAQHFTPSTQPDVAFHIRFGKVCQSCPVKAHCTTEARGRSLEIRPHHAVRAARLRQQETPDFRREMHVRARIESTLAELTGRHRLRRLRYRGWQQGNLLVTFTAVAVNLKRLARHLAAHAATMTLSRAV